MQESIDMVLRTIPSSETSFVVNNIVSPVLLMHGEGSDLSVNFIDSVNRHTLTAEPTPGGNVHISTDRAKFGTASIKLISATNTYVWVRGNPEDFVFDTLIDFTVDFWVYITDITLQQDFYDNNNGFRFITHGAGELHIFSALIGDDIIQAPAGTLVQDQWMHLALTRQDIRFRAWCNGQQAGSTYSATLLNLNSNPPPNPAVGGFFFGNACYIDELRVVKGRAFFTSPFTPPTAPYLPA